MRHERCDAVVVAELDLVGGHGVVLVDDGQDAQVQQTLDLTVRVLVLRVTHEVLGGHQNLAHGDAVAGEVVGVARDQQSLPHGGRSLLGGEILGALGQTQRGQAGGDRTRGDEDDVRAASLRTAESIHNAAECVLVDGVSTEVSEDDPTLTTTRRAWGSWRVR